ncbi:MAG: TetR family transcriptional regulator [Gammaproteobacteria bacterium]|nr:TetR family transcriptional regulator [Gammaproteobacteria bacterium]
MAKVHAGATKQEKRQARKTQIIDAALKILAFEGASSFTLRNVADKTGVTLGAVQYYFKTKSDLLLALTEYKLQLDYTATEEARNKSTLSVEDEFTAVINLLLRDNKKPLIYGLDFQLFALACSDSTAADCVDKFYRTVREWMESLIHALNPKLSESECRRRTVVILAMLEGLMQVLYRDKRNKKDFGEVEEMIRIEALRIAQS